MSVFVEGRMPPYPCAAWWAVLKWAQAHGKAFTVRQVKEASKDGSLWSDGVARPLDDKSTLQVCVTRDLVGGELVVSLGGEPPRYVVVAELPAPMVLMLEEGIDVPHGTRIWRMHRGVDQRTRKQVRKRMRGTDDKHVWEALTAQHNTCWRTGLPVWPPIPEMVELGHIEPRSKGGPDEPWNMGAELAWANRLAGEETDEDVVRERLNAALAPAGLAVNVPAADLARARAQAKGPQGLAAETRRKVLGE